MPFSCLACIHVARNPDKTREARRLLFSCQRSAPACERVTFIYASGRKLSLDSRRPGRRLDPSGDFADEFTAVEGLRPLVGARLAALQQDAALQILLPITGRTNEPKVGRLDGFGFARMQPGDDVHLVELLLFECSALGLHLAELLQGLQETAGQALFIQCDGRDGVFRVAQGFGEG